MSVFKAVFTLGKLMRINLVHNGGNLMRFKFGLCKVNDAIF